MEKRWSRNFLAKSSVGGSRRANNKKDVGDSVALPAAEFSAMKGI